MAITIRSPRPIGLVRERFSNVRILSERRISKRIPAFDVKPYFPNSSTQFKIPIPKKYVEMGMSIRLVQHMSIAPKSVFSAKRLPFRRSVVTEIEAQKRAVGSRSQSSLRQMGDKQATLKLEQAVTKRSRPVREQRSNSINNKTVKIKSGSESIPAWLNAGIWLQRSSTVVTFFLAGAALFVYGGTVYSQQLWSREYRKLEILERKERQLTAAGEVLKNKLAEGAENPDTGLVSPTPENNLFLVPSPQRSAPTEKTAAASVSHPQLTPTPVGY